MKKLVLAGVCVLSLAGCDAVKSMVSPGEETPAAVTVNPAVTARESFTAQTVIVPSADLGKRTAAPEGVTATLTDADTVIVTTSPAAASHSTGRPGGYSIALTPEQESKFSNSQLKVKVLARAAEGGTAKLRAAYSTSEVGNSGWRDFELGPDYSVSVFDYKVQPMKDGKGDFIGFLTEGGPVEIAAVGFDSKPLPAPAAPAQPAEAPAPEGTLE